MMQENLGQNEFQGVVMPQEAIAASNATKAKREKTLAQLPVFRTASNLLFVVTVIVKAGPRSLRRFYDGLLLELHKDKRYIQPVSHGVKFVGSVIKPHRTYLSNKTLARMTERVHGFNGCITDGEAGILDCARIEQVMNSYLGFCRPLRTYRIRRGLLETFGPEFYRYFYIRNHHDSIRTKVKYRPIQTPPEFALAA